VCWTPLYTTGIKYFRWSSRGNQYAELEKRLLGDVYGSTEIWENLLVLCDDYNSRWPGSGDDRGACDYIAGKLEEYGLENVHPESELGPEVKEYLKRLTASWEESI